MKIGDTVSFRNPPPDGEFVVEFIDIESDGRRKITIRAKKSGAGYTCYENRLYTPFETLVRKASHKKKN